MSQDVISVDLEERAVLRKGLQGLRASGKVPAVIHDHGNPSLHVMGDASVLGKVYSQAGKHHPVQLTVGKKEHLALIKYVDFEPVKHRMRHVVFQAIKQDEKVEAEIPVHVTGEIPAVKAGLMVITGVDHVLVEALPKDLIDELTVDGGKLVEIGDKLHVSDIVVPSGVTILTEPEQSLAAVEETKAQMSDEETTEGEAAEGEAQEGSEASAEQSTEE